MKAIYAALSKAQAEFGAVSRDATNPHLKNRYASLNSIKHAIDDTLRGHGLVYTQGIGRDEHGAFVRTRLVHIDSGEFIDSDVPLIFDTSTKINPMQAAGSAVSYARRYGLESLLSLERADDDAEGAFPRRDDRREPPPAPRPQPGGPGPNGGKPTRSFSAAVMDRAGSADYFRVMNHMHKWAVEAGHCRPGANDNDTKKVALNQAAPQHREAFAAELERYTGTLTAGEVGAS